ncbi:sodium/solute symporter [bacterium]|nr:sodium/solute symporter [bacterium]
MKDFFVGGKNLGYWSIAFSSRATGESSWLLLGLTGMGALFGLSAFWVLLGEVLGVAVCWWVMAKPFKRMTDAFDSMTIPDFLVSRFKPKTHLLRTVAAATLSIFVIIYVSAQIDATGKAFNSFLEWNYFTGALVGCGVVLLYSFIGGFVAVVWSDFFQGLLMFLGLVTLPVVGLFSIDGNLFEGLRNIDPDLLNIWGSGGANWANILAAGGFLFIGLGFLGSPQIFVRFMSIRSEAEIDKGRWVALTFTLLADSGAILIGMIARYLYTNANTDVIEVLGTKAEDSLSLVVNEFMPITVVAIYMAVVLSAIMSTIDSLLVVAASAITRDFYQQIYHPNLDEKKLGMLSRIITVAMALAALLIAFGVKEVYEDRSVFWYVIFGWSGIAATFCPVTILAIFWPAYNLRGALASMITGFFSVPFFQFVVTATETGSFIIGKLDVLLPSFLLSMLAGYIFTKLSAAQQLKTEAK